MVNEYKQMGISGHNKTVSHASTHGCDRRHMSCKCKPDKISAREGQWIWCPALSDEIFVK